ncbi:NAD(P)-dependent dehydrogenase (short-subunit alcohol dehydrogenase family) [Saccharomonospora amisosensis]|uniref:NAD(P)-dependent dehydrogenase (Short-subunit alcohol dehydrogenase family) n=2 Tax=Saccharomonospora amisosensis TaxID=1128677 RepID=A0A7X5UPE2_9PSEU|nr:NAD(P)-dependent dehydrogenase (short-subunit alcohol dehydrogenase family) [Saccharomonospora amisosensis]
MGQAIARMLAGQGVAVVVADRLPAGVPNLRQELMGTDSGDWRGVDSLVELIGREGGVASSVVGDIGEEADASRMVGEAVERHGRLDILVNNAAAPQGKDRDDIEEIPIEVWDQVLRINLRGTYLMSRFAVPHMRRQRWGRIVNISSMAGMVAAPRSTAYSASKAGVIGFTRALAMDVAAWGVTVNAVCPGLVGTSRAILNPDPDLDEQAELDKRGRAIPVGRAGRPEDIAAAVRYLASEDAGYVTGQTLSLDGGGMQPFPLPRPA